MVDDEYDLMCLYKDALSQIADISVFGFTESRLALDHIRMNQSQYGLVLSDFGMPIMDGVSLLTNVKAINAHVKTILISAFDVCDKLFLDCDCVDKLLQKRITVTELITEVQRLIKLTQGIKINALLNCLKTLNATKRRYY